MTLRQAESARWTSTHRGRASMPGTATGTNKVSIGCHFGHKSIYGLHAILCLSSKSPDPEVQSSSGANQVSNCIGDNLCEDPYCP